MIDRIAFAKVMGGFADKIGRALAPETSEMYFDVLTSALETEEFLAGARIVFRSHVYNTWPAPQQFIDAAKPKAAAALSGAEAFERVLDLTNQPQRDWSIRHAELLMLGPVVERAFRAVGGRRELDGILEADVPFARRRFLEAYEHAAEVNDRETDAAAALASVQAPRLGETEDGLQLVVKGLAQLKSLPLSGRDRAANAHADTRGDAADD